MVMNRAARRLLLCRRKSSASSHPDEIEPSGCHVPAKTHLGQIPFNGYVASHIWSSVWR
jgi:hypothetical protein